MLRSYARQYENDGERGSRRATLRIFSSELIRELRCRAEAGTYLGGVHLELSGEDVTECVGGASGGAPESDLARAYKSEVDPRLNYEQALEVAMLIAHRLRSS